MANPYTGGTEKYKLFAYAASKGNPDKACILFTNMHVGKGLLDVTGATAIPKAGLAVASAGSSPGH